MKSNQNNDTSKLIKLDSNLILSSEFDYINEDTQINNNANLPQLENLNHGCVSMATEELYPKNF